MTSKIIGSGHYIPSEKIANSFFENHDFMDKDGCVLKDDNTTISRKLQEITGIEERRYVSENKVTSDIALIAARKAILKSELYIRQMKKWIRK